LTGRKTGNILIFAGVAEKGLRKYPLNLNRIIPLWECLRRKRYKKRFLRVAFGESGLFNFTRHSFSEGGLE